MDDNGPNQKLSQAQEAISVLQKELEETNRGLIALTMELERKNEEVRTMSQQLWQTAKLSTMGELAASIAHELNNPLTTVSLRTESLLMHAAKDSSARRALEVITQEVRRMGNLVANLLQFSRCNEYQISSLDLCDEIEGTLELISYHLRKHNIAVAREFASDVPMVHGDRQQLRQLFLNLLTNAGDAMEQGGTLTIRVNTIANGAPKPSPGNESGNGDSASPQTGVMIEIADTGVGIPPEYLLKVMEPFFTTKPEGKGTGLGLPICRRIVQEHGGTLAVSSEGVPGKGTTVRITLPLQGKAESLKGE